MSDSAHEEDHTGPIKTPKQLLITVFFSFFAPVFAIIGLVYYVTTHAKPADGVANAEKALSARIQKVGSVEIRDANRPLKSGEEVFKAQCTACHTPGLAGSPKVGDTQAWGPRLKAGYEALLGSSLKGKGSMGPQGGGDFEDLEIGRAVVFMTNQSGANFPEPQKAPVAVAAAPQAAASK